MFVLFPRKLRNRLQFLAVLVLFVFLAMFQLGNVPSGADIRYIRKQRDILLRLPRDQSPDDVRFRHQRVWDRCQTRLDQSDSQVLKEFHIPRTNIISKNIFYCPVTKAGSTFLTRYIKGLDQLEARSPYGIPMMDIESSPLANLHSIQSASKRRQFLHEATKVVFARDPFSRIFSSYLDKLYTPNLMYWSQWGQGAISKLNLDPKVYRCGSRLSFHHFVKLVVKELWENDIHFVPMAKNCQLCSLKYDIVGKMEHAFEDIRFLSAKLNVTSEFMNQPSFQNESIYDVIKYATKDYFWVRRKDLEKCMSFFDAGRFIWRKLQIIGMIDARFKFPLSPRQMKHISRQKYREVLFNAALKSSDKDRLKLQWDVAFTEAYGTVDTDDLELIQGIYAHDFFLLGYDFNTSSIFTHRKRLSHSSALDWRKNWKLAVP